MPTESYTNKLLQKYDINILPNGVRCLIDNIKNRDENECKQVNLLQFNECSMENNCMTCKYAKECTRLWDILVNDVSIGVNEKLLVGYYHRLGQKGKNGK